MESHIVTGISSVPVTVERKPFQQPSAGQKSFHAGTSRANIASSYERPNGTTDGDWAEDHSNQTVLQQHCEFFDRDRDGVIWPTDTFVGFYRLGFGFILSLFAAVAISVLLSYASQPSWLPDPFLRVFLANIHKDKHGSDSGTYDNEGRFVPQKFEDIFTKYAHGRDYITLEDVFALLNGQRVLGDPLGWGAALGEWLAVYILLWPEDGQMKKEEIRGIFDGSIFYTIAARRERH